MREEREGEFYSSGPLLVWEGVVTAGEASKLVKRAVRAIRKAMKGYRCKACGGRF